METTQFKVFGIGLSKTGTTSLASALRLLGYKTVHYPHPNSLFRLMRTYDAATDTPVTCVYQRLDELFPNSRFILTDRDLTGWLKSAQHHFARRPATTKAVQRLRMKLYRTTVWDEQLFTQAYWRHKYEVLSYFWNRPHDLIQMNISGGDGWEILCSFLKVPLPNRAFPCDNRRKNATATLPEE